MRDVLAIVLLVLMLLEQCSHSEMVDEKNLLIAKLASELQKCKRGEK